MDKKDLRIVYMGTPDFAVEPLKQLVENDFNIVGVVTNPDKPAGRGQKIQESPVKLYAKSKNLNILQPEKFRDDNFIDELKSLNADLQIVVAFKMLPEMVWSMPRIGTFNLHASLLPQYRGAAPINWALINGEEKTGVTTFFLKHAIDTGNIILQQEVDIEPTETAGTLHDKLMLVGAGLVVKTVHLILEGNYKLTDQNDLTDNELKHAPKIFKNDCLINWNHHIETIYNHIRGLSPYPAAWTELNNKSGETIQLKIYKTEKEETKHNHNYGEIISDKKTFFKVAVNGGFIKITELQQAGKRRMATDEFLRGFQQIDSFQLSTKS